MIPNTVKSLREWVLSNIPGLGSRQVLLPHEQDLAVLLRGNAPLFEAIVDFLNARLASRDVQPVPTEPVDCRAIMERQHEVRWLLSRLDLIYRSPVNSAANDDGEQPA